MLAISIVFTACNKDTSLTEVEKNIDLTEQKILDFKAKMLAPNKSGETMSIEDAVWYIEAALNYTYCNMETTDNVIVDSAFVTINLTETDEIDFNNVITAYNELETDLENILGEDNMLLTDIEYIQNLDKSGDATFKLTTVRGGDIDENRFHFNATDYWKPIFELGKCDIYTGHAIGHDASSQVEKMINTAASYYLAPGYATDVESIYAGVYNGTYPDYFWSGYESDCIDPAGMNYWLIKGQQVAELLTPSSKDLLSCEYSYDAVGGSPVTWYHMADFTFGKWHLR